MPSTRPFSWLRFFRRDPSPNRRPGPALRGYRPRFEFLEGRYLPSTVTNLNDSGAGSLRDAIATTPAGGTVDFQPGLTGVITLTSSTLTIDHSLTITGPGANTLTVSGNQQFSVFVVSPGVTATLAGLSIVNGKGVTYLTVDGGGGIDNQGTLTVTGCILSGNQDVKAHASAFGGGIFNSGTLTVIATTLSGNSAGAGNSMFGPPGACGGGIFNASAATLTVINSTLSGNSVGTGGASYGGGICNDGNLAMINSTVSLNSATDVQAFGGGIASGGSLTLTNTIVASNTVKGQPIESHNGIDIDGAVSQADHNLVGIGQGSTGLVNGQNGNQVGTAANPIDPKLGPLQDNSGPTPTQALLSGSPALDAGDNAASPGPTDQRGLPRIFNGTIDIGAYEAQASLGKPLFALGGAPGRVQVHRVTDDAIVADFAPYGAAYTGPVNVAVGDVNGDGIDDLITAAAVGNPDVRVYDGKAFANGTFNPDNPNTSMIAQWFPYGLNFNVGATVAVGDIEHNGFADIVTGADVGNPDVRVYRGRDIAQGTFNPTGASLLAQWFPYGLNFNVGANVAAGDVNGDGFADVVTGATAGNPDVRVYNGKDIAMGTFNPTGSSLLAQFFPYALQFNVGAFVAVGDTTKSGFGDVITGASVGNPDVRVYSGQDIARGTFDPTGASQRDQFFAYGLNFNIGAAVASADFEGTGKFDILTGASAGSPNYRVVKGDATGTQPPALFEGFAQDIEGGIAVGA
jgi:hypothetical protein